MSYANGILQETPSGETGTGNLALNELSSFRAFTDEWGTGGTDVFKYFIRNKNAEEMEFGTGHIDGTSGDLVRDTVLWSTNSNSAVSFTSGVKVITNDMAVKSSGNGPVDTRAIQTDAVTTTEANFTDQALSTTDSPTFGGLTANGDVTLGSNNEIFVDNSNGHVGVATSSPSKLLDVNGIAQVNTLQFSDADGDGSNWIAEENSTLGELQITKSGGNRFRLREFNSGNQVSIILGDGSGSGVDPATDANVANIYGKEGTNGVEIFVQDEGGNTTQISSHDSEGMYYVNHTVPDRGIRQEIDVEKAIKFLEDEFEKDFIREHELEEGAV